jgi:hypothetical protein
VNKEVYKLSGQELMAEIETLTAMLMNRIGEDVSRGRVADLHRELVWRVRQDYKEELLGERALEVRGL